MIDGCTKKGLISVVVPVYNMARFLDRCMNSLLNQCDDYYEIILVDDGSTDDSASTCDLYAEKYSNVVVIHKKNGGLSSARNTGIKIASGEFVIFPDPDDWADPDYLSRLRSLNVEFESDLEICGHYISSESGETIHNHDGTKCQYEREDALNLLMLSKAYCGFAWNKLYHMEIIRNNCLSFDTSLGMAQDLHFTFRYISCCASVAYDPTPVYHYYQHEGGVTNALHPLTERKISGLRTYELIAEMAICEHPKAEQYARSTMANQRLQFMFIYYESGMRDERLLNNLRDGFRENKKPFFNNPHYSKGHKMLGCIALFNPKLFHWVKKTLSLFLDNL